MLITYCASVLEEFAKSERAKNRRLSVTYCVSGCLAGDDTKVTCMTQLIIFYNKCPLVAVFDRLSKTLSLVLNFAIFLAFCHTMYVVVNLGDFGKHCFLFEK